MRRIALLLLPAALLLAVACGEEETTPGPAVTTEAKATVTTEPLAPTNTPVQVPTNTPAPQPTNTPVPPPPPTNTPKPPPPPPTNTAVPPPPPPPPNCHPSYEGACLDPSCSDYDCAGGSGNGPCYTGTVRVVGPDVYGLDRDKDGWGCE